MKNCADIKNKLAEYYYDELPAVEKGWVTEHLISCADCFREYEDIKTALTAASRVKRPALSGTLYYDLKEKLTRRNFTSYNVWNVPLAAGMAVLLLLAGISYNVTVPSYKDMDIEEAYIATVALDADSRTMTDIDFDIFTDEIFFEENMISFGS